MPKNDDYDTLLARFNTLKTGSPSPSPSPQPKPSAAKNDRDIESRFRRLASGSKLAPPSPSSNAALRDPVEELPSETAANIEDEKTLDELLKDLGTGDDAWLGGDDTTTVEGLLNEAKGALTHEEEEDEKEDDPEDKVGDAEKGSEDADAKHDSDREDEDAADEYIAQILAGLELQKKHGIPAEEDNDDASSQREAEPKGEPDINQAQSPFHDLPSAPSTAPTPNDATIADDDLSARLAALSLPTTPSTPPTTKKKPPKPSNLPTYTDEDIDSWCVICNEDATLQCLGCDGDLYCGECWNEGHRGPDATLDEKKHKAIVYQRKKGKRAIAA